MNPSELRPEYVHAVDAARWGVTFWLVWTAPAGLVWLAALGCRRDKASVRGIAFLLGGLAGAISLWGIALMHINYVQSVKGAHMVTEAERQDWSSDAGRALAPFTLMPVAAFYSAIHSATAFVTASLVASFGTKRRAAAFMQ